MRIHRNYLANSIAIPYNKMNRQYGRHSRSDGLCRHFFVRLSHVSIICYKMYFYF